MLQSISSLAYDHFLNDIDDWVKSTLRGNSIIVTLGLIKYSYGCFFPLHQLLIIYFTKVKLC